MGEGQEVLTRPISERCRLTKGNSAGQPAVCFKEGSGAAPMAPVGERVEIGCMAELQRFEKGVGSLTGVGEFLVSEQCIDCDLCRQIAPDIFKRKMNGIGGHSYVDRQPGNDFEFRKAMEALESCPVSAIQQGVAEEVAQAA
jgi:ferredoxin